MQVHFLPEVNILIAKYLVHVSSRNQWDRQLTPDVIPYSLIISALMF
jgi:hypothetical protein